MIPNGYLYSDGNAEKERLKAQESHRKLREYWLNQTVPQFVSFHISEGLPNIVKGKVVSNTVQSTGLVKTIQWDSVFIPQSPDTFFRVTTPEGNERYLYKNRPYLKVQVGNHFEYHQLENTKLTKGQVTTVTKLLSQIANDSLNKGEPVSFSDDERLQFLQHLLFLQEKGCV
jgi:hypothetical protein